MDDLGAAALQEPEEELVSTSEMNFVSALAEKVALAHAARPTRTVATWQQSAENGGEKGSKRATGMNVSAKP